MEKVKGRSRTKALVTLAVLVALQIVLRRFLSFNTQLVSVGLGFVPVVLAGILLGPVPAAVVGGVSDLLGAVLFPVGPYFPGFTLTAALTGGVYGLLLYKKTTLPRILLACSVSQLVLGLFLNTLWIAVLYGSNYWAILTTTRLTQCAGMLPVEVGVTCALAPAVRALERRGVL